MLCVDAYQVLTESLCAAALTDTTRQLQLQQFLAQRGKAVGAV